jgi:hypothetical protein
MALPPLRVTLTHLPWPSWNAATTPPATVLLHEAMSRDAKADGRLRSDHCGQLTERNRYARFVGSSTASS